MTSPLRRKRQTTARSTSPATIRKGPCRTAKCPICRPAWDCPLDPFSSRAFWSAFGRLSPPGGSDDPAADQPAGQAATYSTGKAGTRLKWIGRQPEPAQEEQEKAEAEVQPTQYA